MADENPDFKTWNVKDFPVALRAQITDAAVQQRVTVAVWLAAYFEQHGIDGQDFPVIPRKDNPANQPANAGALDRAIDLACKLAQYSATMPKGVASLAYGLVKAELRTLRGPVIPRSTKERLPALMHDSETRGDANLLLEDGREPPIAAE